MSAPLRVHSNPGDTVLGFSAGSGTKCVAALRNGRNAILIEHSPETYEWLNHHLASKTQ